VKARFSDAVIAARSTRPVDTLARIRPRDGFDVATHPLIRKFPKTLATPPPDVPWWEVVVPYVLMLPGILTWFVGIPVSIGYWACAGKITQEGCGGNDLLRSSTGSYNGIVRTLIACYLLALVCAAVAQLTMKKLHFALVWALALVTTAASVAAFMIVTGIIGTPWGKLYDPKLTGLPAPAHVQDSSRSWSSAA
jgi:hypothetical protein